MKCLKQAAKRAQPNEQHSVARTDKAGRKRNKING